MHSTAVRRLGIALLIACACSPFWLLTACGSSEPHLPHVKVDVSFGPKPREATIRLQYSGSGAGVAAIVLTHPNGHRDEMGQSVIQNGVGAGFGRQLPRGLYEYTVYAVAEASVPDAPMFPAGARVRKNIIASGTFVIR